MGCYCIMKEVYCPTVDYNTSNVFLLNLFWLVEVSVNYTDPQH